MSLLKTLLGSQIDKQTSAHEREMMSVMTDAELEALELELIERVALREDRRVFSEAREESVISWGKGLLAFVFAICVYQLLQFYFLHVASADAEWNVLLMYLVSGVAGLVLSIWLFDKVENRLRFGLMKVVRHREYLVYAAMFAFSVMGSRQDEVTKQQMRAKASLPWNGQGWAILSSNTEEGLQKPALYSREEAETVCAEAGWKLGTREELLPFLENLRPHLENFDIWVSSSLPKPEASVSVKLEEAKYQERDLAKRLPEMNREPNSKTQLAAVCTLKGP